MPLTPEIRWIDTPAALDAACAEVAGAEVIALDTEFFRENTFHPVPALIQFSAGGPAFVVDPLEVECTDAFRRLLREGPLKLLHASSEDLEVFAHWAGVPPAPLVDTQLAQGLLGEDPSMGYQRLVQHWTGETLPKDETRSNWLLRPLSDAQLSYAALDVVYLVQVWEHQRESLERQGRMAWLEADCREMVAQAARSDAADGQWYLRNRQLWRLAPRQIEAYRRLTTWREGEARRRDVPRGWLVNDRLLYAIAERLPENRFELAQVEGVKPPLVKREGDELLTLVREALHVDEQALPPAMPSPMAPDFKRRLKALKRVVHAEAEALGLAPEVLMRRRDLEALVTADLEQQPLPLPGGWRGERLNAGLRVALDEVQAG
ncbi:ribonuclease D [Halomonas heilongjiangensis]|uniref:Ribonuclease D n=1 Tax=Halomonas heilongjiangensis TaxID=1387883 RepID=A0A2N7THL9_9GAMM|nr:ribonuclease D [Halomonas heilongjiangensis]PMR67681.1 ribonuclease D [Halomonas heilongjiangensis]PXX87556.1 ribonuclease D [Halomonas heilongjiangensis]